MLKSGPGSALQPSLVITFMLYAEILYSRDFLASWCWNVLGGILIAKHLYRLNSQDGDKWGELVYTFCRGQFRLHTNRYFIWTTTVPGSFMVLDCKDWWMTTFLIIIDSAFRSWQFASSFCYFRHSKYKLFSWPFISPFHHFLPLLLYNRYVSSYDLLISLHLLCVNLKFTLFSSTVFVW